jgi:hypothetical protein
VGYSSTAHVTRTAPDVARLKMLPLSLGWALYRDEDVPAWYLDTFEAAAKHNWPFTSIVRTRDFPLDLPDELRTLTRVYAALLNARLGHGFRRGFLNAKLFIGKILQ